MKNKENGANEKNESLELGRLQAELQRTKKQLKKLEKLYARLVVERDDLRRQRDDWQESFDCVVNSETWKMTKPFRIFLDLIKRFASALVKAIPPLRLLYKFLRSLRTSGWRATMHKIRVRRDEKRRLRRRNKVDLSRIPADRRAKESATVFDRDICFSILVPLYNTPIRFLNEMISSVQGQTYSKWELCLADGSDAEHGDVGEAVMRLAEKDPRIKYRKLEKNLGISENTNACIEMSTGNFIALFDHDDVLHPSALYEMMCAICNEGADYVYTDEATFESPNIKKLLSFHYKPDYAFDNLIANNYICHFSAFSREVMDAAGLFRSDYDGSQDHDMILRLTSHAKHVVHIPKLLYFWRSHPQSVAMDINSKTYAIEAGKHAVRDHLRTLGHEAEVTSSKAFPTIYRIRYELKAEEAERVSILLPNKNNLFFLRKCIKSIQERTSYPNYEIVIVDHGSGSKTQEYYELLSKNPNVKIVSANGTSNGAELLNLAAEHATGKYLVLLNSCVQIISRRWIEELMMYAQREDVGVTGGMLYYPDNTIYHAGIILGMGPDRIAGNAFYRIPRGAIGYMGRLFYSQNMSAVTGCCMMVKADLFAEMGGFDSSYQTAFGDVDFCLKVRQTGKLVVWTPYAEAYYLETKNKEGKKGNSRGGFAQDCKLFRERWSEVLDAGDPYYNPNFTLDTYSFEFL